MTQNITKWFEGESENSVTENLNFNISITYFLFGSYV